MSLNLDNDNFGSVGSPLSSQPAGAQPAGDSSAFPLERDPPLLSRSPSETKAVIALFEQQKLLFQQRSELKSQVDELKQAHQTAIDSARTARQPERMETIKTKLAMLHDLSCKIAVAAGGRPQLSFTDRIMEKFSPAADETSTLKRIGLGCLRGAVAIADGVRRGIKFAVIGAVVVGTLGMAAVVFDRIVEMKDKADKDSLVASLRTDAKLIDLRDKKLSSPTAQGKTDAEIKPPFTNKEYRAMLKSVSEFLTGHPKPAALPLLEECKFMLANKEFTKSIAVQEGPDNKVILKKIPMTPEEVKTAVKDLLDRSIALQKKELVPVGHTEVVNSINNAFKQIDSIKADEKTTEFGYETIQRNLLDVLRETRNFLVADRQNFKQEDVADKIAGERFEKLKALRDEILIAANVLKRNIEVGPELIESNKIMVKDLLAKAVEIYAADLQFAIDHADTEDTTALKDLRENLLKAVDLSHAVGDARLEDLPEDVRDAHLINKSAQIAAEIANLGADHPRVKLEKRINEIKRDLDIQQESIDELQGDFKVREKSTTNPLTVADVQLFSRDLAAHERAVKALTKEYAALVAQRKSMNT